MYKLSIEFERKAYKQNYLLYNEFEQKLENLKKNELERINKRKI